MGFDPVDQGRHALSLGELLPQEKHHPVQVLLGLCDEGDPDDDIFSQNQSLIIMEVSHFDSGTYTCEARRGEEILRHSTNLESFPAPVFVHPPIWKNPPTNVAVPLGDPAIKVQPQTNRVSQSQVAGGLSMRNRIFKAKEQR